jgi:ribosome-binding factor A
MKYGNQRLASLISRHLADIIQTKVTKDVGIVSINSITLSKDNSFARVIVGIIHEHPKTAYEELNKAKGFIRSELAKKLSVYKVPELAFIYDDSYKEVEKIEKILQEIHEKEDVK